MGEPPAAHVGLEPDVLTASRLAPLWPTRSPCLRTVRCTVSDNPIIPFIEGDGTGIDIWPAAQLVLDAAAKKHGKTIEWKEVLAGEKAFNETGNWLPDETVETFREYLIGIKGPLTTPIGGGIRSLNVDAAPDPRPLRVPAAGAVVHKACRRR